MNEPNPYAPPAAPVADVQPVRDAMPEPIFFAVSIPKLLLMSLCTLGLYPIYWFYRNWTLIMYQERLAISPAWRALFSIFYCYSCFARIRDFSHPAAPAAGSVPAGPLAAGFIVVSLLWRLPDPYWVVGLASPLFLIPAQRRANQINGALEPGHDPNARFSGLNWVALVGGGLLLLLAILGALMPVQ